MKQCSKLNILRGVEDGEELLPGLQLALVVVSIVPHPVGGYRGLQHFFRQPERLNEC